MSLAWPINRVRQEFVDFFVKTKQHSFVQSSPVIPHNDPTLLVINAGMNQFKALFLGGADPNTEFGRLKRVANSQLCIRAGGKHNDLEDVGRDTYHHTFFEMLGSWSFGDYFKVKAIEWAWELLTEVYKLPKDRLYVTYFEGDPKNNIACDDETRDIWRRFVADDHILKGNVKDNFWEMGDTGPCGPCTEIHFDRLGGRNAAHLVNKDDPMVLEIWNIVFMQFERKPDRSLVLLPQPHVDTGMGLERVTSILQSVLSNYDTDAWTPIFQAIQTVTGFPQAYDPSKDKDDITIAYRVVADHIRCITVALADGAGPDSVGRGFVLRRIIRRAIRYGTQFLGAKTGFFTKLVDSVVESLGGFFTHLQDVRTMQRVKAIVQDEEESFAKTWSVGLKHFEAAKETATKAGVKVISGADAFVLHDRYGFPVDLTSLLAEKEGMTVDLDQFNHEMKTNQVSGGRVAAEKTFLDAHHLDVFKHKGTPLTEDGAKYQWQETSATVLHILDSSTNTFVESSSTSAPDTIGLILDRTNFYAESGGQVYDTGVVSANGTDVFVVSKVHSFGCYIAHIGNFLPGQTLAVGASVNLKVDYARRLPIAANHTATHQLNQCLRQALEDEKKDSFMEVHQKGSLVNESCLRFDFSYNAKLTPQEIERVEVLLNQAIAKNLPVYSKVVPLEDAKAINGLRQMFGEKYPDPVSVVCVGVPIEDLLANKSNPEWRNYSIEFCGGTHISKLGDVQNAVVVSEDALMKGVRRVVLLTRESASQAVAKGNAFAAELKTLLATGEVSDAKIKALSVLNKTIGDSEIPLVTKHRLREEIDASIKQLTTDLKNKGAALKPLAVQLGQELAAQVPAGRRFVVHATDKFGADRALLQAVAEGFSAVNGEIGLFLIGSDAGKDQALAYVTLPASLVAQKLSAVTWAQAVAKGGGKPNAAQAGLPASGVPEAVAQATAAADKMQASLA